MSTWARIILDSIHPTNGVRLTTMELNYPYIIHAEVMTHGILSKNASSLRVLKTKHVIERVRAEPFIPSRFPRTATPDLGMEPAGYWPVDGVEHVESEMAWQEGLEAALRSAQWMANIGVHKQIASRPLSTYMYQRTLVTATEWENWDNLRGATRDTGAQDQIQELARAMYQARLESTPLARWVHLPFMDQESVQLDRYSPGEQRTIGGIRFDEFMVSAGRCARISYLNHEGVAQPDKDEALGRRLLTSGHMSPFAHLGLARHDRRAEQWSKNFRGWVNYRETIKGEDVWRPTTP